MKNHNLFRRYFQLLMSIAVSALFATATILLSSSYAIASPNSPSLIAQISDSESAINERSTRLFDDYRRFDGNLRVGKQYSYIFYLGPQSGDTVVYFFDTNSAVGKKILSICKNNSSCSGRGVFQVVTKVPAGIPETTSGTYKITGVDISQAQPQPNCTDPQTQLDMNLCAGQRAQTADRQLNQVYKQVRTEYKGRSLENQLVDAQLAWITFRDRECAFASDRYKGGSIAPMVKSNCIEQLTSARTKELQNYLE